MCLAVINNMASASFVQGCVSTLPLLDKDDVLSAKASTQLHLLRCKHRLTNIQHRANTVLLNPTILPSKGYWPVSIVNSMTPSVVQDADGAVRFDGQNGNPSSNALLYLHLCATASTADSLLVSATEEMQKTLWEVQAAHKHMWLSSSAVKGCCW